MFISNKKLVIARATSSIQIALGIFLIFFWIIGLVAVMTNDPSTRRHKSSTESMLAVDGVMFALSLLLLIMGIRKKLTILKVNKLASIFNGDSDGIEPVKSVASLMGMTEAKLIGFFNNSLSKGYIVNASLSSDNGVSIVLTREKDSEPELVYLKCPDCGGTTSVRKGYSGKCQFCGSPLEDNNET